MITGLGAVMLPLCLWFWRTPMRLLQLVFIGAVFGAAAVFVTGGYGVTPALVPATLFIGLFLLKVMLGTRYPAEKIVLGVMLPFLLVVFGAIASSLLIPRLFEGQILVWPQKIEGFFVLAPLAPNSGNYTQDLYLLVDAALALTGSIYLTREGINFRLLLDTFFVGNCLVIAISLWQFAGNEAHVWFPTNFFLSNPGWALLSEEAVGSVVRITGPFSEPAALAGYLCGAVSAASWVILNGDKAVLPRIVLVLGVGVLLLSTSTTGYAALAIMIAWLLLYTVITGSPSLRKRAAIGVVGAVAVVAIGIVAVPAVAPGVAQDAATIVNATLTKQESSSFNDRTSTDLDSIQEMFESYGLGVGWGSNRSSSLGPGLCASVGVWGILGLLWFTVGIVRHIRAAHRVATSKAPVLVMHGCAAGLLGMLAAAFISAPSITSPDFYLLLALLIATAARVRYEAKIPGAAVPYGNTFDPRSSYGRFRFLKG